MITVREMIASLREDEAQRSAARQLGIELADIGADQKTLAKLLGVRDATVSRWRDKPVPEAAELKFDEFRQSVLAEIGARWPNSEYTGLPIRWNWMQLLTLSKKKATQRHANPRELIAQRKNHA